MMGPIFHTISHGVVGRGRDAGAKEREVEKEVYSVLRFLFITMSHALVRAKTTEKAVIP